MVAHACQHWYEVQAGSGINLIGKYVKIRDLIKKYEDKYLGEQLIRNQQKVTTYISQNSGHLWRLRENCDFHENMKISAEWMAMFSFFNWVVVTRVSYVK
jgi:hypothetical protein